MRRVQAHDCLLFAIALSALAGASRAHGGDATAWPQFRGRHASGVADGARLDDVLGEGGWLIARDPPAPLAAGLRAVALSDSRLAPFRERIEAWLASRGAEAVLVRPDRYVFGTGDAGSLAAAWSAALSPAACAA